MAAITSTTGLISGLNYQTLIDQLMSIEQQPVNLMAAKQKDYQATQAALTTLSATLLTVTTSATNLNTAKNFASLQASVSDASQLSVKVGDGASVSSFDLQVLRLASSQQFFSKGFVNSDSQLVGAGAITVADGGRVDTDTLLSTLNGGAGVHRGVVRITDRSGASADVDLSAAATVTDVLNAINSASGISVNAAAQGDKIVLTDKTGQSSTNLTVTDKSGGRAAVDLGISQSVSSSTLTGSSIYQATGAFTLTHLNDGNQIRQVADKADLRITLTDASATTLDVDLNGALTLNDVVQKINGATGNDGKLTASISNGRLVLTDNTGGGGAQPLGVADINGAQAAQALGLSGSASGNTLTGKMLVAGINSVLLRNLNGGAGITQTGQITLTDRTGTTATVDLTGAESLDQVLTAINGATSAGSVKLQLSASLNAAGNRIVIQDTSAASASNLVITDVGGGTLASQLGLTTNAAQTSVQGAALNLQYVNQATTLDNYSPSGSAVRRGGISVIDSTGTSYAVNISDSVKTIGDVLDAISTTTNGKVTGKLNATGDGFELIDQAGGTQQLQVKELGGTTARDLRLLGTASTGGDGKSHLISRLATTIDVTATDTLATLKDKLNSAKAGLSATIVNDGTSFSPNHLLLTAGSSGASGRLVVDDGGLNLGLALRSRGNDALLQVGSDPATGYVLSSGTNQFTSVEPGIDVSALKVSDEAAHVDVVLDTGKVADLVKKFVDGYNAVVAKLGDLTKFDATTGARGALQGDGLPLRLKSALTDLSAGTNFGPSGNAVKSLTDLGISFNSDGTLSADTFGLQIKVGQLGDAVNKFFLDTNNGFAAKLKKTIESFTDPLTGQITEETNSLKSSVDTLQTRIDNMNSILDIRRNRLLVQFTNLETTLGKLQTQQQALAALTGIAISNAKSSTSSSSSSGSSS